MARRVFARLPKVGGAKKLCCLAAGGRCSDTTDRTPFPDGLCPGGRPQGHFCYIAGHAMPEVVGPRRKAAHLSHLQEDHFDRQRGGQRRVHRRAAASPTTTRRSSSTAATSTSPRSTPRARSCINGKKKRRSKLIHNDRARRSATSSWPSRSTTRRAPARRERRRRRRRDRARRPAQALRVQPAPDGGQERLRAARGADGRGRSR